MSRYIKITKSIVWEYETYKIILRNMNHSKGTKNCNRKIRLKTDVRYFFEITVIRQYYV